MTKNNHLKKLFSVFSDNMTRYSQVQSSTVARWKNRNSKRRGIWECFIRLAKSSLFNLCGWIVSIKNCCKVISRTHKDQACGIYCLYLELGRVPAHTACWSVDFDFDREAQATTPSVNGSGIQVFTGLPASQAHRGVWCGIWEASSRVSCVLRAAWTNKQLFTDRVKY